MSRTIRSSGLCLGSVRSTLGVSYLATRISPLLTPVSTENLTHILPNGLVLLGQPMPSLESAAFSFLLPAGCCHETPEQAGLASMTCEMMLRGSGDRDSHAFITDLENLGVERSESVGVGQASYGGATLGDNLLPALEVFADLLRHPHLPADQLEAGRSVCLQELRGIEDEPSHQLMIELRRRCYSDPWGRHSLGDEPSIRALSIDDIRQYHARCYQPSGTILAVAGRFDWERLREQVETLFGDWQAGDVVELASSPCSEKNGHLPFESSQSHIGIAYPSIPYNHPDYFQAWASVGVLSSGSSSRLFTEVRERRGLCYTVSASLHTLRDRASVMCYAGNSAVRAQETLDVTCQELLRLSSGIEENELDRLKARIKSALIMQQESTAARSGAIARDWYHLGRVRTLDEIGAIIDGLTCESINAYLAENPPRDLLVVTLGPEPLEVPVEVS